MRAIAIAVLAALIAVPGVPQGRSRVQLKKAPGVDKVEGNCAACHSLDYILMNSPFPERGAVGRRGRQDDQGIRCADRRRRCQDHRRVSEEELRQLISSEEPRFVSKSMSWPDMVRASRSRPASRRVPFSLLRHNDHPYSGSGS